VLPLVQQCAVWSFSIDSSGIVGRFVSASAARAPSRGRAPAPKGGPTLSNILLNRLVEAVLHGASRQSKELRDTLRDVASAAA